MALGATGIFEVNKSGADTNGGFFDIAQIGATGTDHTLVAGTAFTVVTTGTTTVTASAGSFDNTMLGSGLNIVGDSLYCIVGFTSSTIVTVDRATGTSAGAGAVVGGSFLTTGRAGQFHVPGNIVWVKFNATPYQSTTTSSNVSNGKFTSSASASATATVLVRGYDQTRGDETANRPTVQWGTNAGGSSLLNAGNAFFVAENIIVDGNRASFTGAGLNLGTSCSARRVKILNCTFSSLTVANNCIIIDFELTNNIAPVALGFINGIMLKGGYVHGNTTASAFTVTTGNIDFSNIIFDSNTGGDCIACTGACNLTFDKISGYNNSGSVVSFTAAPIGALFVNSYFSSNGAYGINPSGTYESVRTISCAFFGNTSGKYPAGTILAQNIAGEVVPSVEAFTAPGSQDFSLNTTTGGGAAISQAGYPQVFPGLTFANKPSIGAAQGAGSSGGGTVVRNSAFLPF